MNKPIVLFIDECCNKPYDSDTLTNESLGGTEATVVRIAEKLGQLGVFNVLVEQHNRLKDNMDEAFYVTPNSVTKADYVICLRSPLSMIKARERFPNAKIYLWSHDLCNNHVAQLMNVFEDVKCAANIVVSNFHKLQSIDTMQAFGYTGQFKTIRIYNPIDDELTYKPVDIDKDKLCFISSPHKGLDYTLEVFNALLNFNPKFRLHICNPGYYNGDPITQGSIVQEGYLPHHLAIDLVRNSLCLFYPNTVFPETFGLVLAEANAVGTPVITHNFGAAKEVLDDHPDQLADCRNKKALIDRVMKWYTEGRPTVRARPQFRLSNVIKDWINLLK